MAVFGDVAVTVHFIFSGGTTPKIAPSCGDPGHYLTRGPLGPPQVHNRNGILIGSAIILLQLTGQSAYTLHWGCTVYGNSKGFEVKVGMHQGSALSPLLFVIVMEAISREFRDALPWELWYADDLAVIAETEDELIKRLHEWKDNVDSRGMRVNMNKVSPRHGTGSHFVILPPSDPGIQRPGDPVDPVTLFYNELQMSTYVADKRLQWATGLPVFVAVWRLHASGK